VYLKSVTLKGFKSFPDRTRLEFGPGVSVIVGPNGSGKSNVTDAVLWALGEQSPVAVRGQSMQDVIFGGGPGRQAAGHAEVELVLDDGEGELGLGAPEVSIVRRFDRSGEGEYRLAGARCRLVDVLEVLSDTGLGKEMHSVISQGRIESLVTSKPRERRLLIEEAAGLGKHRKRRRRAALRLQRTQDNLDRALDVEREARSRLRPLKRQAEAAELHERLHRQSLEIRWELARDDVRDRGVALGAAQAAAADVRARRERLAAVRAEVAAEREAAEEALAARGAEREAWSHRAYAARAATQRIGDRIESLERSASAIAQRRERAGRVIAALAQRAEADAEDPELDVRIERLAEELTALDRDREAELARQLAELETRVVRADARVAEAARAADAARERRAHADATLEGARTTVRVAERGAEGCRREAARIGGELAGVNRFLRDHAIGVRGAAALADELEVEAGYELAVAAALDGRLGAALAVDRDRAGGLLDEAGEAGGRALVLGGASSDGHAAGPSPGPGAERLVERVRGAPEAMVIAGALLRATWVVEDLAALPADFDGVAVTRAGRVWSAAGRELRQAPAVGEDRVLAERNRRQELIAASEAAVQAEVQARAQEQRAAGEASRAEAEREREVSAHRRAVRGLDEAQEERRRIAAVIEQRRAAPDDGPQAGRRAQLTAELAAQERLRERARRERAESAQRLAELREAVRRDEALAPALDEVRAGLIAAAEAARGALARLQAALAADREAGEQAAGRLRAAAAREATLHAGMSAENDALTRAEVTLERARDRETETRRVLGVLAAELELAAEPAAEALHAEAREGMQTRLQRLARRREQLGPVNPLAQREYAEAVAHVEELEVQRADLEAALRELQTLISDTDRQIRTTFEQTFAATAAAFTELAAQLFPGGSGELRVVTERDGAPRVLGGASDGTRGADDGETHSDGDADGNGDGDATPQADEERLGVEIEITPAGKDRTRLSLLSGGEKSMTALAFLFAVFLARPCPFYILDEVEAALDDLNIDRFLALLRQYAARAQFIVVTHQKRTMEAADSLYGVSMGADGISKVISQRLPPPVAEAA